MSEIEINDFIGMMPSSRKPPLNAATLIRNFDLRGVQGDLELRNGYDKDYDAFTHTYLTTLTFWEFESLYVPETDTEHFIVVGKGTTVARTDTLGFLPYAILIILSRTAAEWTWINDTIHTGIFSIDPDTVGDWEIELDFTDGAANYDGWTVLNISTVPFSFTKVVKTSSSGGGRVKLELSSEAHGWASSQELFLMKNYIPHADLVQIAANVTSKDISFHRVLNDLRIGFGGKVDRMGIAVGYRKYYLQVNNTDFKTYSDAEMETFAKYDGMMVTPHTILTDIATISLTVVTGGSFSSGTYYLRITGVLDDLSEILLNADASITIASSKDIKYEIFLKLGPENLRLTKIKVYFATSDLVYEFLNEHTIRLNDKRNKKFNISYSGDLSIILQSVEMHSDGTATGIDNAASTLTSGDILETSRWTFHFLYPGSTLTAVADVGGGSDNVIRCHKNNNDNNLNCKYESEDDFIPFTTYDIDIRMSMVTPASAKDLNFRFLNSFQQASGDIVTKNIASGYNQYQFELTTRHDPKYFMIMWTQADTNAEFRFDRLSITVNKPNITLTTPVRGSEISDAMGYTPTLNMISAWDSAIVTQGRSWMIGAYIDKRYLNLIFFSVISGAAANMYDALPASKFYDLENFDGGELKSLQILPNLDFLGLKSNGPQRIDSFSGRGMDIDYGAGLVARKGAVNLGKNVIYPGEYDIMMSTLGIRTKSISDGTIRTAYRLLTDNQKSSIIATREEKDNAYRMFTGDTSNKTEYILTKRGWIEAARQNYPEAFTIARNGDVLFMNTGIIYKDSDNKMDNGTLHIAEWNSIDIDAELMGIRIDIKDTMILQGFYLFYTSSIQITVKIYLDYASLPFETIVLTAGDNVKRGHPLKTPAACRSFQIRLQATVIANADYCNIHSVIPDVAKKTIKRHAGNKE